MKKLIFLLSIGFVTFFAMASMAFSGEDSADKTIKLVVAIPFTGIKEEDVNLVQKKINEITEKEIGVTVEFPDISTSTSYYYDVTTVLSTTEQLDIMLGGFGSFMECYVDEKLMPLDELLEQYGQDIIKEVGEDKIHCCDIHNVLYGIPVNGDYSQQGNCYVMRKDILEKYNILPENIRTMEDLEEVFEIVKEKEKGMTVLDSGSNRASRNTILANLYFLDASCGMVPLTACMDNGREEELISTFESEEYKQALRRVRRWYLKGYINEEIYGPTKTLTSRIEKGEVFAYATKKMWNSWNSNEDDILIGGREMVIVSLDQEILNYNGYSSMPYVITKNSISPEMSMKLLNLFYSNKDIANLLCYGVEGVHYKKMEDGRLTYMDGKEDNPFLNNRFNMPNQYIAAVWEGGDMDFWEQIKRRNEEAVQSSKMGFNFDYSKVDAEYTKISNIYQDYKWILENGLDNPEKCLEMMLEEMKKNGLDLVLREQQEQYEIWKNKKE